MENKTKFGKWEVIALVVNVTCMQIYLNFPRTMAESAGTAAWIETIYISILAIIAYGIIAKLQKNFQGKDVVDVGEYWGGGFGRTIIGLICGVYAMLVIIIILREFGENMKTVALPDSPLSFVVLFFIAAIIAGAYIGFEAVVRLNVLIFPVLIIGYIIILIGVSPKFIFGNLTPLLGNGVKEIFVTGSMRVSVYGGLFVLVLIPQYIENNKILNKAGYISLVLAAVFFTTASMAFQLIYPYPRATQHFLPIYNMARSIAYGRFFQRIESIFLFMWAASGMIYLSAIFNLGLISLQKAFRLNYIKPLVLPLIVIVFTLSFFPRSLMSTLKIEGDYLRNYAWSVLIALPIIILSIGTVKKHRVKGKVK